MWRPSTRFTCVKVSEGVPVRSARGLCEITFQVGQKRLGGFCACALPGSSIIVIVMLLKTATTMSDASLWRNIAISPF
jgi:hypothetical protein